jgi:hypothetical protein
MAEENSMENEEARSQDTSHINPPVLFGVAFVHMFKNGSAFLLIQFR